jgi:hypothetical protein
MYLNRVFYCGVYVDACVTLGAFTCNAQVFRSMHVRYGDAFQPDEHQTVLGSKPNVCESVEVTKVRQSACMYTG